MAAHRPRRRDRPSYQGQPSRPGQPSHPAGANPPGSHALADHLATRLVRQSPVGPHDLVFDLGAGLGAITAPLARIGARIIAVERDPRLAARLTRRLADHPNVSVITADALTVPLPRRPYLV